MWTTCLITPHLLPVQLVHFHHLPVCLSTCSVRGCEAEQCESLDESLDEPNSEGLTSKLLMFYKAASHSQKAGNDSV